MAAVSVLTAAKQYKTTKPTILTAIRNGKIPAQIITVYQIRVNPKDVAAYVKGIPDWRRENGRRGGLVKAANRAARLQRRASASAGTAPSA